MRIVPVSDLHSEFAPYKGKFADGDVLVLAGDIFSATSLDVTKTDAWNRKHRKHIHAFLTRVCAQFELVLMVAGNHEFYGGEYYHALSLLQNLNSTYPNFHFLHNETYHHEGVDFIGSTLWTSFNEGNSETMEVLGKSMNDYENISIMDMNRKRLLRPEDVYEFHWTDVEFLKSELSKPGTKVVITHHAPTFYSAHPRYLDDIHMLGAYSSNLDFLMEGVSLWIHGHIHDSFDYVLNGTRVVDNPYGYYTWRKEHLNPKYTQLIVDI